MMKYYVLTALGAAWAAAAQSVVLLVLTISLTLLLMYNEKRRN
jgi:hypothetical protein